MCLLTYRQSCAEPKTSSLGDLLLDHVDFICELAQIHLTQLLVLKLFDQRLGVLAVHEHFKSFDVAFIVLDPLAQGLDIVCECGRFCCALCLDALASLRVRLELTFKLLQLAQVLVLNLRVLHLNDVELLLVLARCFPEASRELIRLLCIQLL